MRIAGPKYAGTVLSVEATVPLRPRCAKTQIITEEIG
jgi:hypothetical protein